MPKKLKRATKTKTFGNRPSYLDKTPTPDEPDFWQRVEWNFTFALENLTKRFVQTEEEAAGSFVPADITGGSKNDWFSAPLDPRAFPHVSGLDEDDLSALLEIVETHYDEVCKGIQERRLSSEFLWRWGAISWAIGSLEAYSRLDPKPDGHKRAAISRDRSDKDNRESWYARQIIRIQIIARRKRKKAMRRTDADRVFARLVHGIAYGKSEDVSVSNRAIFENEQVRGWCRSYVNQQFADPYDWRHAVKTTYTNITAPALKQIRRASAPGLPDLDLEFPQV